MRTLVCIRPILVGLVSLLVGVSPLLSQTITGSLRGTVTDESGSILPGVTVELAGQSQIGGAQSGRTT